MGISELKQDYVDAVYETRALMIKEQPFDLKSGGKSHIYLNHRNLLSDSKNLRLIAELYNELIKCRVEEYKLCAVDSVMSPIIVGAMSILSGKDIIAVKSKKLEHGTKEDIYGDTSGEVVVIDDMTSSGSTILSAAKKLKEKKASVRYAVVSACRDDKAKENLEKEGIQLLSIASFREIIGMLKGKLGEKELRLAEKELR
ncbi:hypothetical protein KY358_03290 [Candidatus Woesearchaeota archaeon]|nr:hypothetical protein [Candidatus Woesearchaeota archaeon]